MARAVPGTVHAEKASAARGELSVVRADPLARLVQRLFRGHRWRLFVVMALLGVVCVYVIPAAVGTLQLRAGFDSALSDVNSAIIWLLLVPTAAMAYLDQLDEIPALFARLRENGVTGLKAEQQGAFLTVCRHWYNRWFWAPLALVAFALPWALFMQATASSPYTWYYPPVRWPWLLYCAIQYLEIYGALTYALRFALTCLLLRMLLKGVGARPGERPSLVYRVLARPRFERPAVPLRPQFLHPDGLGGFGPITAFVLHALIIGGGVLVVVTLESVNTASTLADFGQSSGLLAFIVVALLYATVVPWLLLYPLRLALVELRHAKHELAWTLSQRENAIIWERIELVRDGATTEHGAHVDELIARLRPLGQISAALETVPESLFELGRRSSQVIVASTVLPPLLAILYRIAADVWGWNWDNVIRGLMAGR